MTISIVSTIVAAVTLGVLVIIALINYLTKKYLDSIK